MKARKVSTIFWYPQTEWKLALSISGKGQQPPGQVLGCVLGPPHGSMQWPWTESSWLDSVQLSPSSSALGAGPVPCAPRPGFPLKGPSPKQSH